jgi:hypothetical protein
MPRSLTTAFRRDLEVSRATDVVLMFLTFSHDSWATDVYLVNDVVNYTYGGNLYIGFPFQLTLLTDDERPPRGQFTVQNVDRRIGELLMGLVFSPVLKIEVLAGSGWNAAIDVPTNSRLPIGSPAAELVAQRLQLWEITVTAATVVVTFGPPDISQEFWPTPRATKQNTPGLFR